MLRVQLKECSLPRYHQRSVSGFNTRCAYLMRILTQIKTLGIRHILAQLIRLGYVVTIPTTIPLLEMFNNIYCWFLECAPCLYLWPVFDYVCARNYIFSLLIILWAGCDAICIADHDLQKINQKSQLKNLRLSCLKFVRCC